MMKLSAYSFAIRNFRCIPAFVFVENMDLDLLKEIECILSRPNEEKIIGCYLNPGNNFLHQIPISERGVYFYNRKNWELLPFDEMSSVVIEGNEGEKKVIDSDYLLVTLQSGEAKRLYVAGGNEELGTRDTFSMQMFLERAATNASQSRADAI